MKPTLLTIALVATTYASAAFLMNFDSDCTAAIIVALLALGGVFWIDHRAHERERMAQMREAVWRRRIEEPADWEMEAEDL